MGRYRNQGWTWSRDPAKISISIFVARTPCVAGSPETDPAIQSPLENIVAPLTGENQHPTYGILR